MEAETQRASTERQLALLVDSALDYAIFMLDVDGRVLTWNAGAERMKGYSTAEIVGRHVSCFYAEPDVARRHPDEVLDIVRTHGRHEEEGWRVRKDGTRFWANAVITAVHDDTGRLIGFGTVSRDLTARRQDDRRTSARVAQLEAVNKQLSEFRRLVSSVRDYAIFMLDPAGVILTWNAGAEHLKGYRPEEAIGRHFSIFYPEEARAREHPAWELAVAEREGRYEEEGWRVRKDGSQFWASVTITAIRDEGRLTGFAKVTRDLTERRAAQQSLEEAVERLGAANAELDRFASVAAHDMTDPLRTMSGFAEILELGGLTAEETQEYAGHIRASSQRLTRMLQGLLTYARAGRSEAPTEPVALEAATAQTLADLSAVIAERDAVVDVHIPDDATVAAHRQDVGLLLQNLISNAIKFGAPDRPRVAVRAEPVDGRRWRVTVEDNGAGIAPADQERIFNAFERAASADQAGYGLGLAICQRVARRHGGEIGLESKLGQGSRFWFSLHGSPPATVDA